METLPGATVGRPSSTFVARRPSFIALQQLHLWSRRRDRDGIMSIASHASTCTPADACVNAANSWLDQLSMCVPSRFDGSGYDRMFRLVSVSFGALLTFTIISALWRETTIWVVFESPPTSRCIGYSVAPSDVTVTSLWRRTATVRGSCRSRSARSILRRVCESEAIFTSADSWCASFKSSVRDESLW